MKALRRNGLATLLCLLALTAWTVAIAADPRSDEDVIVIGDADERVELSLTDGQLVVVTHEHGETATAMVDIEHLGDLVALELSDALEGLDEVLADLGDMQFQMRLGNDNRLNLAYDDSEFEIDLDQIMVQVSEAVSTGLAEIDVERWCHTQDRHDGVTEAELQRELDALQREMKELRRELRRLQKDEQGD